MNNIVSDDLTVGKILGQLQATENELLLMKRMFEVLAENIEKYHNGLVRVEQALRQHKGVMTER